MAKVDMDALTNPSRDYEIIEPKTMGFWLSVGSLMFVLTGIFLLQQNDMTQTLIAWGSIFFFGLCLIVGLLKLFGKPDTLSLDQDGFTFSSLGKSSRMEWRHIAGFGTYTNGPAFIGNKMVGMNMIDEKKTKATSFANALVGYDGALPTAYGVKPLLLAQALQKRLEAYQAKQ